MRGVSFLPRWFFFTRLVHRRKRSRERTFRRCDIAVPDQAIVHKQVDRKGERKMVAKEEATLYDIYIYMCVHTVS